MIEDAQNKQDHVPPRNTQEWKAAVWHVPNSKKWWCMSEILEEAMPIKQGPRDKLWP